MSIRPSPGNGAVPTSSGHNRYANKRMWAFAGAIAALVALGILYAVAIGLTA